MGGSAHGDKTRPRADLTDDELRELCVVAVRQHRDEMRLWASLRVGLVNHLGHEFSQDLEVWVATFYANKKKIPLDSDVEEFAKELMERKRKGQFGILRFAKRR
uniref:Uncharacterized protein n=1 Tax=Hemiselmis andersenii TaxID=464988 RepID=A0A6U4JKY3_HEMAN|mmetsp:Transcript_17986/g.41593  ORF Transcript_17986/g.41593 Transcript_17986/m.41593 type:complete len:104 (+) Transcript_17986:68-379(+)